MLTKTKKTSLEQVFNSQKKLENGKIQSKSFNPVHLSILLFGLLLVGFTFGSVLGIYHDYTTKDSRITYYRPAKNIQPQMDPYPSGVILNSVSGTNQIPATGGGNKTASDTATYTIQIKSAVDQSQTPQAGK